MASTETFLKTHGGEIKDYGSTGFTLDGDLARNFFSSSPKENHCSPCDSATPSDGESLGHESADDPAPLKHPEASGEFDMHQTDVSKKMQVSPHNITPGFEENNNQVSEAAAPREHGDGSVHVDPVIPIRQPEVPLWALIWHRRGDIVFKVMLVALVFLPVVVSFWPVDKSVQGTRLMEDMVVIPASKSKVIDFTVPGNVTHLTLTLQTVSIRHVIRDYDTSQPIINIQSSPYITCENALNISQRNFNRWTDNSNILKLSCWVNRTDSASIVMKNVTLSVTNQISGRIGVLLYLEEDASNLFYNILVLVIIAVTHFLLLIHHKLKLGTESVLMLSALSAGVLNWHLYQAYNLDYVLKAPALSSGSLLDQVLQITCLTIMVNVITNSHGYTILVNKLYRHCKKPKVAVIGVCIIGNLLAAVLNRICVVIVLIYLVVKISDKYRVDMTKTVSLFLLSINAGNTWTAIGNDITCQLLDHELSSDKLISLTVWMVSVGVSLCIIILGIVYCTDLTRKDHHDGFYNQELSASMYKHSKAQILYVTDASYSVSSKLSLLEEKAWGEQTPISDHEDIITTENRTTALISTLFLMVTLTSMQLSIWLANLEHGIDNITPGILAFAGALSLLIITDQSQNIMGLFDMELIVVVAAFRFTMQNLLSIPILDWMGDIFEHIYHSSNDNAIGAISAFLWLSAIQCAFIGSEAYAPSIVTVIKELYSTQRNDVLTNIVTAQVLGASVSGGAMQFSSLANVVGIMMANKHSAKPISQTDYLRIGLPTTLALMVASNIGVLPAALYW